MAPSLGGAGTAATNGTAGAPPWAGSGTGGISGAAGMVIGAGTGGVPPISGAGSEGGGSVGGGSAGTGGSAGPVFDPGTDPNRNAVVAGIICSRLAVIQCAGEAYCCANPRDRASCEVAMRSSCTNDALVDDIAADPAASFDAARALIVFTEIERLASQCDPTIAAYGESFEGLRSIFRGTVGPDGDCRPANPLNMSMAGAALASCTGYQTQACVPSLTDWRCTPHAPAGGHCFSDLNCVPGLYCDNPNFSVAGANCLPRKAVGTTCALDNECQTLFCRGGSCAAADVQTAYCPVP